MSGISINNSNINLTEGTLVMNTFSFLQGMRQRSSSNNYFRQKKQEENEVRETQLKDAMSLIEETKKMIRETNALLTNSFH